MILENAERTMGECKCQLSKEEGGSEVGQNKVKQARGPRDI